MAFRQQHHERERERDKQEKDKGGGAGRERDEKWTLNPKPGPQTPNLYALYPQPVILAVTSWDGWP